MEDGGVRFVHFDDEVRLEDATSMPSHIRQRSRMGQAVPGADIMPAISAGCGFRDGSSNQNG